MKYLFLIILLSSCSVIRRVNKSDVKTETKIEAHSEEKTETQKDSKIKTVTTEEIDTTVNIPANKLEGSGRKDFTLDDGFNKVEVDFDSTGKVSVKSTVKPQTVTVYKKKKTEKFEDIKEVTKQDSIGRETKQASSEIRASDKEIKKTGLLLPFWLWILIVLAIAGGVYWKIKKPFG